MTKRITLLLVLAFFITKAYSQQRSHTLFDKDSLVSVTNYINKFQIIDSLVIKTSKKKIIISERSVIRFYGNNNANEELGICPFATEIFYFDKRIILMSAIFRNSFSTSFYIFSINVKTGKIIKIIKTKSYKKGLNKLTIIIKNKIIIPKKVNFISSDTIKVINKNRKIINLITTSSKCIKSLILGDLKSELEKESYFEVPIK